MDKLSLLSNLIPALMNARCALIGKMKPEFNRPLIYIVDDQAMLLDLAEASLSSENYDLQKFHDPQSALESFIRASTKPDLLITDYAMGGMNGLELVEKCKALQPQLRTILISGTMGAEIILDTPVQIDRFLPKPYQPSNLAELVHLVLEQ